MKFDLTHFRARILTVGFLGGFLGLAFLASSVHAKTVGYWRMEVDSDPTANLSVPDEMGHSPMTASSGALSTTHVPAHPIPRTGAANLSSYHSQNGNPIAAGGVVASYDALNELASATIEFWTKTSESGATFIEHADRSNGSIATEKGFFIDSPNNLRVVYNVDNGVGDGPFGDKIILQVGGDYINADWVHVAFTYDMAVGLGQIYIDGDLKASHDGVDDQPLNWFVGNFDMFIGAGLDSTSAGIDEIRISDVALTPDQFLNAVPEPTTLAMLGMSLLLMGIGRRTKRCKKARVKSATVGSLSQTIVFLIFGIASLSASAEMTVYGEAPSRHDRFYTGGGRDFIGEGYDWSGVGKAVFADSKWATMISDSFFLSANHSHPNTTASIRFYYGNDPAAGSEEHTVAGGVRIADDLWLGWLNTSVSNKVMQYALLAADQTQTLPYDKVLLFGKRNDSLDPELNPLNQRVGRNIYTSSGRFWSYSGAQISDSLGVDEALSQQGDSGAPTFILVENQPVMVGTRWFKSGDMNVSALTDQVRAQVQSQSGGLEDISIVGKPATTGVPLLFEDFQTDVMGFSPKGGRYTVKSIVSRPRPEPSVTVVAGTGQIGSAGNALLQMAGTSNAHPAAAYFESIATSLPQGVATWALYVEPITGPTLTTPVVRMVGGADTGNSVLGDVTNGATGESMFELAILGSGAMQIATNAGVVMLDQSLTFGQSHVFEVYYDTQGANPGLSVWLDGGLLTSNGGAVDQFALLDQLAAFGGSRLDSLYFEAVGDLSNPTQLYLDNLFIGSSQALSFLAIIPEPTTGLSMCLGAMLIGWRRRCVT